MDWWIGFGGWRKNHLAHTQCPFLPVTLQQALVPKDSAVGFSDSDEWDMSNKPRHKRESSPNSLISVISSLVNDNDLARYHHISSYIIIYHHISSYIIIYHHISSHIYIYIYIYPSYIGDIPHDLPNLMAAGDLKKVIRWVRVEAIQVHGKFTGDSGAQFAGGWPGSGRQFRPNSREYPQRCHQTWRINASGSILLFVWFYIWFYMVS